MEGRFVNYIVGPSKMKKKTNEESSLLLQLTFFFMAFECSFLASLRVFSSALSSPSCFSYLAFTSLLLTPPDLLEAGGGGGGGGGDYAVLHHNTPLLTLGAHAQRGLQYLGLSVCVCVCLLSHISPTERLFVLKTLSHTQRATKVKKFVGICLKRLRSRVMPRNMSEKANMLIISTYPMSAFSA